MPAVLYEMVACRPAFPAATTAEVFAALLCSEPDTAGTGPLGGVIAKALAKEPSARYQPMAEFAEGLRNFDPTQTRAIPARRSKRRPFWSRARTAAVAASLVAAAALVGYIWITSDAARDGTLKVVALATFAGPKGYAALSPDGSRIASGRRLAPLRVKFI